MGHIPSRIANPVDRRDLQRVKSGGKSKEEIIPVPSRNATNSSNCIHNLMGSASILPAGVPKTLAQLWGQHPNIRLVEYFIMNSGDFG